MRTTFVALALVTATTALPAAASAQPYCLTPVGSDGHEPICNPHLAQSPWAASHRGSYAQGSSAYPAPSPGQPVRYQRIQLAGGSTRVPVILQFSDRYRDGGRAVWWSVVSSPDVQGVGKADFATGQVISQVETTPPRDIQPTPVGVYNLLDRDGHFIVTRQQGLEVFGDERVGDRLSPIKRIKQLQLPRSALCRPDDQVIGITMTFDGYVAYVTAQGMVGVVPREPARMTPANVRSFSLNGARCGDATVPTSALELVSNSLPADEDGGIYPITSKAQYRVQWDGHRLQQAWRAPYASEQTQGGVRVGEGSGSTPDVVGSHRGDDKLVVATDGQKLMHLVIFWRDRIPRRWKPIAPGKDRRIACEMPVTFGDPNATESNSEQSVLTRGYSSVVVNNKLKNEQELAALPVPDRQRQTLAALSGQNPQYAPYGLERIDWDPKSRTCKRVWVNREVSIPNGVPTLSTQSNLVYGIGQRNGVWGLEGVDFTSGRSALRIDASAAPQDNSLYAAATVGPDNTLWSGTGQGLHVFRGPRVPEPRLECRDLERPAASFARRPLRLGPRAFSFRGAASDRACGKPARPMRVLVSVARRSGRRCRFLGRRHFGKRRSCRLARYLPARGTRTWRYRRRVYLGKGRYLVRVKAVDRAGNASRASRRSVLRVTIRVRPSSRG